MKSFGAKVKEQRGNLGLSQKQLAEKAGMGIRTIRRKKTIPGTAL